MEKLTVRAGDFVLQDITLEVAQGRCGVVVGPSGAGKSTLLEAVAGLRQIECGRILLKGKGKRKTGAGGEGSDWLDITGLPPERRGVALVPQDYALFPHLTAEGNILLAPRLLRLPTAEVQRSFSFLCELLGLTGLLKRQPHQLSGGERQRVALARALMLEPNLILLDEPFAALDPQMRPAVRRTLRGVFQTLNTTVLIVTHDLLDAAALGDCVFVMENGRIVQQGAWAQIVSEPKSDFVAEFLGLNRFVGVIVRDGARTQLATDGLNLPVRTHLPGGARARLLFFPSQARLVAADEPASWRGVVSEVLDLGERTQLAVDLGEGITVRIEAPSQHSYRAGDIVSFTVTAQPQPDMVSG